MKRLNKAIIFIIVFVLSFSIVVSAAASYNNPVNMFDSDSAYFELTEEEQVEYSDLIYNGKICVEYTHTNGRRVRSYVAIYSSYKNFAAYMYQEAGSSGTVLDYLIYKAKVGDILYLKWAADINDNNFVKLSDSENITYQSNKGLMYDGYGYSGNKVISHQTTNAVDVEIISTDFPIFQTEEDYLTYRETGIVNNALYNPTPKDYSSELYFKSFDVIPHVSNSAKYYYFDIKYELSDYAKKNLNMLNLNFENCYSFESEALVDTELQYKKTPWMSNSISLKEHPYGFSIYINELGCYRYAIDNIGISDSNFVLTSRSIDAFNTIFHLITGREGIINMDTAYLYFKFNLRFSSSSGVVIGKRNDFTYDFLTKEITKSLYVPDTQKDTNGNTVFVKDTDGNISYTQEGDTKTSKDYYSQEGDKYYYTDNNGSKKEITENDYNNSSANVDIDISIGNGSGEYITISPVDFNQFIKGMEEMLKQLDTKGGLFLLIKDVFSMYPPEIVTIVVGALSTVTVVSIICILRR